MLNGGDEHGNPRPGLLVYEIGGRYLALQSVGAPRLWSRLLGVMGRQDLANDPRFASSDLRRRNGRQLRQIIAEWVASRFSSVDEALTVLADARIPCAPVLRPHELIGESHLAVRAFFPSVPHPVRGSVRVTASPYHIDGEAVLWAHQRLLARREQRRILIVVSDGTPVDEATAQANGFEYLDDHLYRVVRTIEQQSPIQLAAIGIGHDVSRVYANATKIAKIDQLGPALTTKLIGLLS